MEKHNLKCHVNQTHFEINLRESVVNADMFYDTNGNK